MERELKRVDTIARVRRAFHAQGWSMKKISRELHVSRNTVRKILRSGETDFAYEREHQPQPKIGRKCSIPDDQITPRRSGLFMARSILRERCGAENSPGDCFSAKRDGRISC